MHCLGLRVHGGKRAMVGDQPILEFLPVPGLKRIHSTNESILQPIKIFRERDLSVNFNHLSSYHNISNDQWIYIGGCSECASSDVAPRRPGRVQSVRIVPGTRPIHCRQKPQSYAFVALALSLHCLWHFLLRDVKTFLLLSLDPFYLIVSLIWAKRFLKSVWKPNRKTFTISQLTDVSNWKH